ncbi:MAG: DNA polymerase III subunit alpha, partial [Endomicrobium sp.]|nr:DNA polymerase III subunit alpha [Endomicrobium sp.]
MAEFVHLHNHTEYSLLDGACRITTKGEPSELFDIIAKEHKSHALAITDHGNMYGAMEFYWAAKKSGIKPIIGCEVYVAPKSRFDKTQNDPDDDSGYYRHLILLAKDYEGYQNLMRIVSAGFLEGFYYKPRVDKEVLAKYSKGIIAMSGCIVGEVANFLLRDEQKNAIESAIAYRDIFGADNFYLEIMDHGLEYEKRVLPKILELSQKTQIPLVATNDCHFLRKEDYAAHDVLLCIGTKKNLNDTNRLKFASDLFYYRSPEEMINLFSYKPDALKNTLAIAEKINLEIDTSKLYLPKFAIPKEYKDDNDYLETLCWDGLKQRYPNTQKEHKDRLNHELTIIKKMGFSSYFLIVQDFIKYAKDNKIPVGPGRGSGAGSIVAYTLGITDICPLQYGLLFERFLNPDRISMPDLDIDFADTGRDAVKEYVRNKYGDDKVAQIITFGSLKSKAVIKDVARVMQIPISEANQIAALIPQGATLDEAINNSSELKKKINSDEKFKELWGYAKKLEGLKRHAGVHAAGVLIANEAITNYSPLSRDKNQIVTTQYDGDVLPKLGLLKVDFLAVRTLSIIEEC